MNVKRHTFSSLRISMGAILCIVVFISILGATGVIHSLLSNDTLKTTRAYRAAKQTRDAHLNEANLAQMKINERLGYFEIQKRLLANKSELKPLDMKQLEIIPTTPPQRLATR